MENYLKMKSGYRWMEMYLDPHLLVFLSRLSDISRLKEQVWNSGYFGMTEAKNQHLSTLKGTVVMSDMVDSTLTW